MIKFALTTIYLLLVCKLCQAQSNGSQIKIIADYNQLNTITQLLSPLKGKPVYVDLWATWCEPCKEEFKYSSNLYEEFDKRGIRMLYVSMHKNVAEAEWRSDIDKFQLKGSHVLSSKALQDAFTTLIWGGIDAFSIPHYLLYDAKGKLLLNDAPPPSSQQKLLSEIDKALSN